MASSSNIADVDPEDLYESLPTASSTIHMVAGSMAGILEHCVMYPVDSVKYGDMTTGRMVEWRVVMAESQELCEVMRATPKWRRHRRYGLGMQTRLQSLVTDTHGQRGLGSVLMTMMREEGALRPLRGMGAMVAGAGPAHAFYFAAYERLKVFFTSTGSAHHNYWAQGAAASAATLIHDGIMTPAEVVKQRLQMYNSPFRSMTDCAIKVYRSEGLSAFYRSYGTQIVMNVPFQCVHFIVYEAMQNVTNPERRYNPLGHVVSGGVSGALAAAFTTPLDVCKTLLNTQEAGALERTQQKQISGLFNAAKMVYRLGGVGGFFQGLQARVLYQVPSTAICWSVYEFFKYFLTKRGVERGPGGSNGDFIAYDPATSVTNRTSSSVVSSTSSVGSNSTSSSIAGHVALPPAPSPALAARALV